MRREITDTVLMGSRIRARRKELGLSATQVAVKAGLSLAQYSRIELGKGGTPYAATLKSIALALDMPELWLIEKPLPPDDLSATMVDLSDLSAEARIYEICGAHALACSCAQQPIVYRGSGFNTPSLIDTRRWSSCSLFAHGKNLRESVVNLLTDAVMIYTVEHIRERTE